MGVLHTHKQTLKMQGALCLGQFPGYPNDMACLCSSLSPLLKSKLPSHSDGMGFYQKKIHLLMYSTIKVRNGIQATPQGRRHYN
jgi:hypothetical protein